MQLPLILGLAALGVNASPITQRQDPVIFSYNISQNGTCATLPFSPAKEFHRSQIPSNGCVSLSSLTGNSNPVTAFLLVRTFQMSGICRRMFLSF